MKLNNTDDNNDNDDDGDGDTCCWPWSFIKSSRLPPLVFSVLFCCSCFSLEVAEDWRTLPLLKLFCPCSNSGGEEGN